MRRRAHRRPGASTTARSPPEAVERCVFVVLITPTTFSQARPDAKRVTCWEHGRRHRASGTRQAPLGGPGQDSDPTGRSRRQASLPA